LPSRPTSLEFRLVEDQLFGYDPAGKADYKILWCANGAYSHYVLYKTENKAEGFYVYVDDKDPLYRAIYDAEMRLIYKAVPCQTCKVSWVGNGFTVCYNCQRREREMFKRSKHENELEAKLWETLP
jgi:hypothetical protein